MEGLGAAWPAHVARYIGCAGGRDAQRRWPKVPCCVLEPPPAMGPPPGRSPAVRARARLACQARTELFGSWACGLHLLAAPAKRAPHIQRHSAETLVLSSSRRRRRRLVICHC